MHPPDRDPLLDELAVVVQHGVGLHNGVLVLLIGRHGDDFVGGHGPDADLGHVGKVGLQALRRGLVHPLAGIDQDLTGGRIDDPVTHDHAGGTVAPIRDDVDHLAVGRLDEAILIHSPIGAQGADQADIGAFGRLDRADAAVVGVVDVAHVKAGALAAEAAGAEGAEAALVGQLVERVGLLHELRELASAKELADCGDDRPHVDEGDGRHLLRLADRHALAHNALHAQQADAELVLDQLAHRLDAAVAQVVDVVGALDAVVDLDDALDDVDQVHGRQRMDLARDVQVEALVELVAAHFAQVVAPGCKEHLLDKVGRVVAGRRVARAELLVQLELRVLDRLGGVFLDGRNDVGKVGHVVRLGKELAQLLVGAKARGPQQDGDRQLALAVDLDADDVALGGLELEPGAPVGDQLGEAELAARKPVFLLGKVDAGRADELADDDALGAVDDKGAVGGHQGEIPHEDVLGGPLVVVAVPERDPDVERRGIGHVAVEALFL